MPLVQTRGAASAQGFGEFAQASVVPTYIEDVFSTYLYTGNGSTQTITNGIDLSTKGGLVWIKDRTDTPYHVLTDTTRGVNSQLYTNSTANANSNTSGVTAFNSNGFNVGSWTFVNTASDNIVSWTFREQPKFFDVVTFTADLSNTNQRISHNLGSVPGTIIIKCTNIGGSFSDWWTYHRSLGRSAYLKLNTTAASTSSTNFWGTSDPTSTDFGFNAFDWGLSGGTYVAYLFAHDAGGFGLTGTDNVISCGSFTTDGSGNATVNLGYEPQWMMLKTTGSGGWFIRDTMRGFVADTSGTSVYLAANATSAEGSGTGNAVTATGTQHVLAASTTYIYIAIRRGPMKVPTTGTSVFSPVVSSVSSGTQITAGFPVDLQIFRYRAGVTDNFAVDRLRGVGTTPTVSSTASLYTDTNDAENAFGGIARNWDNTGFAMPSGFGGVSDIFWNFRRAPSFFDEVCYTGTGANRTVTHNLAAVPELMIIKSRSDAEFWAVYNQTIGNNGSLSFTDSATDSPSVFWNTTTPTSSVFSLGVANRINGSAKTYVAYLFATCAGVSKVGSYTGNGTTQTINCGFGAGGARFVLIKRTDATGDWYVYDTARGMTVLTDPYLWLNSSAVEAATLGSVTTVSTGFALNSTIVAAINISAGTYIFLAIA